MSIQSQVPADHPMMVAWEAYKASDEYSNTKRWAAHVEHVDGSLWAAFVMGWNRRAPVVTRDALCAEIFHRIMAVDEFGNVNVWLTPENADACIKEAADAILALIRIKT